MNSIKLVQRRINPNLKLFGIALTMYQKSNLCDMVHDEVRRHFPNHVFDTVVPRNIDIASAPSDGAPIAILKKPKRNKGSKAYWAISKEIHRRVLKIRHKYGISEPSRLREYELRTKE